MEHIFRQAKSKRDKLLSLAFDTIRIKILIYSLT